jgi:hypothetical protein
MELENFTAQQIITYLANDIQEKHGVSLAYAKKLLLNALTYNVVREEINAQVDYMMEAINAQ